MNPLRRMTRSSLLLWTSALLTAGLACMQPVSAQLTSSNFSLTPPLITEASPPNVMLVMSDDQELYKKAYSDFTDIDGDGLVDGTYKDTLTYTGYFDPNWCYNYDTTNGRYTPTDDITSSIGANGHSCLSATGRWSGNFMNWATMSRMDMVRYVLYGGARSTDTATSGATQGVTVLERAFLPIDLHSFVHVFTGATQNYTPWTQTSISLCNTTYGAATNAPVIRVAYGAWPLWATSDIVQCFYRGESDSGFNNQPDSTSQPATYSYNARVVACSYGKDNNADRCKAYTSSTGDVTYKPIGLLQKYGDSSQINFGLMTGSVSKKISGGVLRKNIVPLTGNSTASLNEVDLNSGVFLNQTSSSGGIINTLTRMRIINYDYTNHNYSDCDTYGIDKTTFKTSTASNRQCYNWGNPLSEIYLEALRYFTGNNIATTPAAGTGTPTAAFNTSDATLMPSWPQLTWTDPLSSANSCASCSIIVLSTGNNTFDKDDMGSVTDIWSTPGTTRLSTTSLNTALDNLGTLEGITNGSYLIGDNGTTNDGACTAKTISALSSARGLCPDVGDLEGGYYIAALAYHAYTHDLRNDFAGVQNVTTYTVSLADNTPTFSLAVNGKTVTLVPTCKSNLTGSTKLDGTGWTRCSFVNAYIESQNANGGSMWVAWEDSLWGNDYDMDAVSRIEWCIGTNTALCPGQPPNADYSTGANTTYAYSDFNWKTTGLTADSIQIRTSAPQAAAGDALMPGFVITGVASVGNVTKITNQPSAAMGSGATQCNGSPSPACSSGSSSKYIARGSQGPGEQFFLLIPGGNTIKRLTANSGNAILYHEPLVYTASTSSTGALLKNPLWYTAKYGSFNDIDKDGTPKYMSSTTDNREWDSHNVAGQETPDGIPDNYFPITNPSQLINSLTQIFEIITSRISSGTAAAVVANSSTGLGSVYQAYYHPQYTDSDGTTITWGGVLHSMFIDASGRFREDNPNAGTRGKLDDTNTDYIVDIFFDKTVDPNRTRFQRYTQSGTGASATLTKVGGPDDLENLGSIWNARNVLGNISQSNVTVQRTLDTTTGQFNDDAGNKRYIFTWLDSMSSGTQGVVDSGEVTSFIDSNFDSTNGTNNYRYLGLSTASDAAKLVKYIRGQDQSGWRSRLVTFPGDTSGVPKYWMLGDIVHSSPLVVNPPNQRYDLSVGDETYQLFKQQYAKRRQMVITGGNDGMIHAFNGGVWDAPSQSFKTTPWNPTTSDYTGGQSHTLGAEMWAYVPMNLLPHLQWLKEKNYPHVYYVDAPPQAFDVNIFANDSVHPYGWGTIMVVGMRLGGGNFPLDLDGNGTTDRTMGSAFIIMDITDPERPPTLLAELRASDQGFTTSMPTVIKTRTPDSNGSFKNPASNKWILIYGSGPDTLTTAVSNGQRAKLYAYDLVAGASITLNSAAQVAGGDPNGFFGDFTSVDWEGDFVDDVVYAGTVEGTETAPTGRMKRLVLSPADTNMGLSGGTAKLTDVFNMSQPVVAAPKTQQSILKNERWILYGTGRLFTKVDNRSSTQQSFYGIKEPANYDTSTLLSTQLVDSTTIIVKKDGTIKDGNTSTAVVRFSTTLNTFNDLWNFMDNRPGWVTKLAYSSGTNPSERVFNTSVIIGTTVVFTSYIPPVDQCLVEGNGYLYALNYRTGTAEVFAPLGDDTQTAGYAAKNLNLGQGAPSAPSAVIRTGDDKGVSSTNKGDVSIVSGSTTGVTTSTGFASAQQASTRMSWEQLKISF
ncbi:MAG TPA: hypothetical protein VMH83_16145 [Candidatus Acidoferrum sp.]|nr:hypothetical protein [Candidatus Acidoferrum sp.]